MRSKIAAAMVTVGLLFTAPTAAFAAEGGLSVTAYAQEKSNWCWAAAIKMIVKYKTGNTVSQCSIFKSGKNTSTCPNETGTRTNVATALDKNGMTKGNTVTLTFSQVKSQVSARNPIYSGIKWKSGGGHAHVVRGWYDTGYSFGVSYIDPSGGVQRSREWGSYKSNSSWDLTTAIIDLKKK
jgi:hypothetical protein